MDRTASDPKGHLTQRAAYWWWWYS